MGAYISLPTWWRSHDQRYRLVIGECKSCKEPNFPPTGACTSCNSSQGYNERQPEGTGEIAAHTVIEGAAPPEFADLEKQQGAIGVVIVELDEGPRVPGMLTDCDPHGVGIGDHVERVIRRIYKQEGIVRYGSKFRPK